MWPVLVVRSSAGMEARRYRLSYLSYDGDLCDVHVDADL